MTDIGSWYQIATEATGARTLPGRHEMPDLLLELWDNLDPDIRPVALADTWTGVEMPLRVLDHWTWAEMFRDVGFVVDGRSARRPRRTPDLFRAAHHGSAAGMSWTDDIDLAKRFTELRPGAVIYRVDGGTAHRALLARFTENYGRGEREFVLDPDLLFEDDLEQLTPVRL